MKKLLSFVLALLMVLSCCPLNVWAEEAPEAEPAAVEEVQAPAPKEKEAEKPAEEKPAKEEPVKEEPEKAAEEPEKPAEIPEVSAQEEKPAGTPEEPEVTSQEPAGETEIVPQEPESEEEDEIVPQDTEEEKEPEEIAGETTEEPADDPAETDEPEEPSEEIPEDPFAEEEGLLPDLTGEDEELTPLNAATDVKWDGCVATWSYGNEDGVAHYLVKLFKDDVCIERCEVSAGCFEQFFVDEMHDAGSGTYAFSVTPVGDETKGWKDGPETFSEGKEIGNTRLANPENVQWGTRDGRYVVGWESVEGATEYEYDLKRNGTTILRSGHTEYCYCDSDVDNMITQEGDGTYVLFVAAKGAEGCIYSGDAQSNKLYVGVEPVDTPESARFDNETETLYWSPVEGAAGYRIEIDINGDYAGTVNVSNPEVIPDTMSADMSGFIEDNGGGHYDFHIIATGDPESNKTDSEPRTLRDVLVRMRVLDTPENVHWEEEGEGESKRYFACWNEVDGANGYRIHLDTPDGSEDFDDVEESPFELTDCINGEGEYSFCVTALGDEEENICDSDEGWNREGLLIGIRRLRAPEWAWFDVEDNGEKYILHWESVEDAGGYRIRIVWNRNTPFTPYVVGPNTTESDISHYVIQDGAPRPGVYTAEIVALGNENEGTVDSYPNSWDMTVGLERLLDPTGVTWDEDPDANSYVGVWDPVDGAAGYWGQLFRNTECYDDFFTEETSWDFSDAIKKEGKGQYDFFVKAVGDYEHTADSNQIWNDRDLVIELTTLPNVENVRWDERGDRYYACWDAIELEENEGTVAGYSVAVYRNDEWVYGCELDGDQNECDLTDCIRERGEGEYRFSIYGIGDFEKTSCGYDVVSDPLDYKELPPLDMPENLTWIADYEQNIYIGVWNKVEGAVAYRVYLSKNDEQPLLDDKVSAELFADEEKCSYDFSAAIREAGYVAQYEFYVIAEGDGENNADSRMARNDERLTLGLTVLDDPENLWWDERDGRYYACWSAVSGAAGYTVNVFRDDDFPEMFCPESGKTEIDLTGFINGRGYGEYVFIVCACGDYATTASSVGRKRSETLSLREPWQLNMPWNPHWEDRYGQHVAVWDPVDGATGYFIMLGSNHGAGGTWFYTVSEAYKNFTLEIGSKPGQYEFQVTALGNGAEIMDSESNWANNNLVIGLERLPKVKNLRWDGMTAKWDAVPGAAGYCLFLEGDSIGFQAFEDVDAAATQKDLSEYIEGDGECWFSIYAIGDYETTACSERVYSEAKYFGRMWLDYPGSPKWIANDTTRSYVATWEPVEGAAGYVVTLNKNGAYFAEGETDAGTCSYDFSTDIERGGYKAQYIFNVYAKGDNEHTVDSGLSWNELTLTLGLEVLPDPTNLRWDGYTAKWDAVADAAGYNLMIFGGDNMAGCDLGADETEMDISDNIREWGNGKYSFAVFTYGDYETTASSPGTFSEELDIEQMWLEAPENVGWDKKTEGGTTQYFAVWDPVEGATGYRVSIDFDDGTGSKRVAENVRAEGPSLDVTGIVTENGNGDYWYNVCALGDNVAVFDSWENWNDEHLLVGVEPLPMPENVGYSVEDGTYTVYWSAVDRAAGYRVMVCYNHDYSRWLADYAVAADVTEADITKYITENGVYSVQIHTLGNAAQGTAEGEPAGFDMYVGVSQMPQTENAKWIVNEGETETTYTAVWDQVEDAYGYEVWLVHEYNEVGTFLTADTSFGFTDILEENGPGYYAFTVRTLSADENTVPSDPVWNEEDLIYGLMKLDMPQNVHWEVREGRYVAVWNEVAGAEEYFIVLGRNMGQWSATAKTENPFYDFTDAINSVNGEYDFQVKALGNGTTTVDSEPCWTAENLLVGLTRMPFVEGMRWDVDPENGTYIAKWSPVEGATGYLLIIYDGDHMLAYDDLGPEVTEMNITPLVIAWGNGIYQFSVAAFGDGTTTARGINAFSEDLYVGLTKISAPASVTWITDDSTHSYVATWTPVSGAPAYYVQLERNGERRFSETMEATSYDFSEIIGNDGYVGEYKVFVVAKGDWVETGDSDPTWNAESLILGLRILPNPENLRWDGYAAAWDAVTGAQGYHLTIFFGEDVLAVWRLPVADTSMDISGLIAEHGDGVYTFAVYAYGDYETTASSTGAFSGELEIEKKDLDAPDEAYWQENEEGGTKQYLAVWSEVEGAAGYCLSIDFDDGSGAKRVAENVRVNDTFYDATAIVAENGNGDYWYNVKALGDGITTCDSWERWNDDHLLVGVEALPAPENVWYSEEDGRYTVYWSAVEGAAGYRVMICYNFDYGTWLADYSVGANVTETDITEYITVNGAYTVQIHALGNASEGTAEGMPESVSLYIGVTQLPKAENVKWVITGEGEDAVYTGVWDEVSGANGYEVWLVHDYEDVGTYDVNGTSFDFTDILKENGGGYYYFTVTAKGDGIDTFDSELAWNEDDLLYDMTKLDMPENVRWIADDSTGSYVVCWDAVENADTYIVWLGRLIEGTYYHIVVDDDETAHTSYDMSEAIAAEGDGIYTAIIKAKGDGVNTIDSEPGWNEENLLCGLTRLQSPENAWWSGNIACWDAVEGAAGYEVTVTVTKEIETISEVFRPDGLETSMDCSAFIAENGAGAYEFSVRAVGDPEQGTVSGDETGSDVLYANCTKLAPPANPVWSGTTAKWGKVTGAAGYEIVLYCINSDDVYFFRTTATTYKFAAKFKELGPDGYLFDVRALGNFAKGTLDSEWAEGEGYALYSIEMLPAPETADWDGTTAKWSAVEGASGYLLHLDWNDHRIESGIMIPAGQTEYDLAGYVDQYGNGLYEFGVHTVGDPDLGTCTGPGKYAQKLVGVEKICLNNVRWEGYTALWDAVPNAVRYEITLNREGKALRSYKITDTGYDFEQLIKEYGPGVYSFDLVAKGDTGFADDASYGNEKDFTAMHVTLITLSDKAFTLGVGETAKLSWTITPDYAEDAITLSSSKPAVCTVDEEGNLEAVATGAAVITVMSENGKKATCKVTVKAAPTEIVLSENVFYLGAGEERTLTATLVPKTAAGAIEWISTNDAVVTVENGVIKARGEGSARIDARTYNGQEASCSVVVSKEPDALSIESEVLMAVKQTVNLPVDSRCGSEPAYGKVTYLSSDAKVAKVDAMGNVTAVKPGTVTVTATLYNGVSAACAVTVVAAPVKVVLNETKATLKANDPVHGSLQLVETVLAEGTPYTGAWTSSKPTVAVVDAYGSVTAVGAGTATITYKTYNGKSGKCTVKVCEAPDTITLDSTTAAKKVGDVFTLAATIAPAGFEDALLTWTSSNVKVAEVDETGKVTVLAAGKAVITVKTENGKTAKCTVSAYDAPSAVALDMTAVTKAVGDDPFTLIASITPAGFEDTVLTWTSSNPKVAAVDADGTVTILAKGKAVITVKTENGKTAKCTVTVK